jgi:hypothetical protein
MDVRALIDAIAGVVADLLRRDVAERVVDQLDGLRYRLEPGQPLLQVRGEPALALLTVIDDVEADLDLAVEGRQGGLR